MNYFGATTTALSIVPKSVTATETGSAIDLQGAEGDILFNAMFGSLSGSDATFTISLTDCDTSGGSYTAVSNSTFATVPTFASDNTVVSHVMPHRALRRYVKVVITITGTTTALVAASATYRAKTA